ncbi:Arc family DNA-binding protein [Acetobacter sp.]|nr:Arc family DNA-binding protein [Acetobacter sp.]MCC6106119.1 Arc family DNA-binding protein [Acetobacter sp.]
MSHKYPQMHIRVPEEVKAWLENNARENERPLNGEVVFQLKQAMGKDSK